MSDLINNIDEKYKSMGHDSTVFLKGLLHSKPLDYWDYIQVDTLLTLQKTKTDFSDEYIFVVYHQITELLLALIHHEIKQIIEQDDVNEETIALKVGRINRYMEVMESSFTVMSQGMDYQQYNTFRLSLAPASGFQAVSFRMIELMCTDVINIVKPSLRHKYNTTSIPSTLLDDVYWKDAGMDRTTGKKSLMLIRFEKKYLTQLQQHADAMQHKNLNYKIKSIATISIALKNALRRMDYMFNVKWPLAHLKTAESYLIAAGQKTASTGMSDWQKYLHPNYQRRTFFPTVWSDDELANWGNFEVE
jgi:tryptophan 2,3-dioxygenase